MKKKTLSGNPSYFVMHVMYAAVPAVTLEFLGRSLSSSLLPAGLSPGEASIRMSAY